MEGDEPRPRPLREWREKILHNSDELNYATGLWLTSANRIYAALFDGEWEGTEPQGFQELTYLLATACDIGPANIDPTPLTRFLTITQGIRLKRQGKFGRPADIDIMEGELTALGEAIEAAIPVLNRMTWAWVALEGRDPPGIIEHRKKMIPKAKTRKVIDLLTNKSNDQISAITGETADNIRTIRSRYNRGEFDLES